MTRHAAVAVEPHDLRAVAHGTSHAPHSVLGPHVGDSSVTIRTLRPLADAVVVVTADQKVAATHEQDGIWVAVLAGTSVPDYRIDVTYDSLTTRVDDPYRFLPTVGELDRHLVREGRHEELWTVLGANIHTYPSPLGDVSGTAFAVWAPNARAIRVIGDFNHWQGATHAMRSLGDSGVWELFVPGVGAGTRYKFEILGPDGSWRQKADPVAKGTEVPPATASVVVESHFAWADDDWITTRASSDPHTGPLSIYEVHLGSWRQGLSYRDLATQLTDGVIHNDTFDFDDLGMTMDIGLSMDEVGGDQALVRQIRSALSTRIEEYVTGGSYGDPGFRLAGELAKSLVFAQVSGADVGSQELEFRPGEGSSEHITIDIGTAGSTTLVVQTILVPALITGRALHAAVIGGTHNPFAPPFEFLERVFLPHLRAMGAHVSLTLEKHGVFPAGGGKILLEVRPATKLTPIAVVEACATSCEWPPSDMP